MFSWCRAYVQPRVFYVCTMDQKPCAHLLQLKLLKYYFITRGLDPFKVIVRKLSWSFRSRVLQSDNILLKTVVNNMYFMWCKLSRKS